MIYKTYKLFLLYSILLIAPVSYGQFSTVFTENFDGCVVATLPITCGTQLWSVTGTGSRWTTTNSSCAITGLFSLAVGSDATFCEYNRDFGSSDRIAYTEFPTTGFQQLDITFDWKCMGEAGVDFGRMVYSNDGITWNDVSLFPYQGQILTQTDNRPIPSALNDDPTAFIGFRWVDNNITVGVFPGLVVDNIVIKGEQMVPPDPATPFSNVPVGCDSVIISWGGLPPSPSNVDWYWQGTVCGTDTAIGADTNLTVYASGTYYIRAYNSVSGLWSVGCDSVSVTIDAPPTADAGPGGTECDLNFIFNAVPSVGTGAWSLVSGPGTAAFIDSLSPGDTVTVSAYGNYVFMWTEVNGVCSDNDTVSVTFTELPSSNAGTGGTECDLSFAFNAAPSVGLGTWTQVSGPGITVFSNPNNPQTSAIVTGYGSYFYLWTEVNGICSDSDSVSVNFFEQPVANAGTGSLECDLNFTFNAVPSVGNGVWSQQFGLGVAVYSDSTNPTSSVTVNSSGTYVFRWTEANGPCTDFQDVFVTFSFLLTANAGPDTSVSLGNSIMLDAQGGLTYLWTPDTFLDNPNIPNPTVSPLQTTIYVLTASDINGCFDVDTVTIEVLKDFNFIISNLMTPNSDGFNDFWYIDNIDFYPDCEVSIYNRYGFLLYNAKTYLNNWDGTYPAPNGQALPDATYYYIINCPKAPEVFKGGITILKKK